MPRRGGVNWGEHTMQQFVEITSFHASRYRIYMKRLQPFDRCSINPLNDRIFESNCNVARIVFV